uniref:Uncharacterized protein n=1 Tax=Falco tinnunculus TaxID=100819 RepID=A0A8C4UHA6_FALTI
MLIEFLLKIPMCFGFFFPSQLNIRNAEKVSTINKAFAEVQKEIQQLSKGTAAEPQKNDQVISLCKNLRREMKGMCMFKAYILALRLQAIHAVALKL